MHTYSNNSFLGQHRALPPHEAAARVRGGCIHIYIYIHTLTYYLLLFLVFL